MVDHDVGLVVLDSIAALTRVTGPSAGRFDDRNVRQSELVARIAQRLKWIAETCDVPVLVTNQVMDARWAQDRHRGGQHVMETADCFALSDTGAAGAAPVAQLSSWVLPALGNTWSHCVNVRVALEITDARAGLRRARIVKAPHMAEVTMHFRIAGGGVEEVVPQPPGSATTHMQN
jgi:RecA/RadA recombinase